MRPWLKNVARGLAVGAVIMSGLVATSESSSALANIPHPLCGKGTYWNTEHNASYTYDFDVPLPNGLFRRYTYKSVVVIPIPVGGGSKVETKLEMWFLEACSGSDAGRVAGGNLATLASWYNFADSSVRGGSSTTYKASEWHEIHGDIAKRYWQSGLSSVLGTPTTNEIVLGGKPGRFNHFERGSIYWSSSTGAWEVHGAIRDKWASLGWENGFLGFPTTNENVTPNGRGRYNHFQGGSVYWSGPTGAHEVRGAIRDRWAALGWENSQLGFPTSDEYSIANGGRRSDFENNCRIDWYPSSGATAYCTSIPRF